MSHTAIRIPTKQIHIKFHLHSGFVYQFEYYLDDDSRYNLQFIFIPLERCIFRVRASILFCCC